MSSNGAKKQFTKFQVLSSIIPKKVTDEVKDLLCLKESEFPANDAYKQLKTEILRIFGPKPEAAIERALGRVLVGTPSQLARALVRDICKKKLRGCQCCPPIVTALWKRSLSTAVKAGIAHCSLSYDTFNATVELADKIHETTSIKAAAVAAVSLDETQPALQYPTPEIAATSRGGRGRGGGRGGRGGRGRGRGRGNSNQNSNQASNQNQPQHNKGTKHPDLPDGNQQWCSMHFKHGKNSYFCADPTVCPWKNVVVPRPNKD